MWLLRSNLWNINHRLQSAVIAVGSLSSASSVHAFMGAAASTTAPTVVAGLTASGELNFFFIWIIDTI